MLPSRHAQPEDALSGTPAAYAGPHPLGRVYALIESLVAPGETVAAERLASAGAAAGIAADVLAEAVEWWQGVDLTG
eukprot:10140524-Alexandrium_andersonii.AAC.1